MFLSGGIGAVQLKTCSHGRSRGGWSSTGCLALAGAAVSIGEDKLFLSTVRNWPIGSLLFFASEVSATATFYPLDYQFMMES
jgi:hypothetical protein